ncbi:hypothetical protein BJ165DRAFT_1531341 [Panaeolus papilionaceus]|nr:hypothetical protein BJ165DRAFT_1531341 [Panaeolus papilionaceus]
MAVIKLDNTLGAAFLGNVLAGVLYGITCLQTFVYFKQNNGDRLAFRALIYSLWVLDSVHLALITEGLYFYLITNYANPIVLLAPHWTFLGQVYITLLSDFIVRLIYARRVWLIARTWVNILIAIVIILIAIVTVGAGVAFASLAFIGKTFSYFPHISYLMYMALGLAVAADILIAASLCFSLSKTRTGFKQTDSVVNVLMMYVINSSLLTTVCALGCLIAYAIWPNNFVFIGIYFCLSKLFLNSLLAMLNGRDALKSRVRGTSDTSDEPRRSLVPHSRRLTSPGDYTITSFASKDAYVRDNLALSSMPRVVINVDQSIETRTWDESKTGYAV